MNVLQMTLGNFNPSRGEGQMLPLSGDGKNQFGRKIRIVR
jgi:hypothetical protein